MSKISRYLLKYFNLAIYVGIIFVILHAHDIVLISIPGDQSLDDEDKLEETIFYTW